MGYSVRSDSEGCGRCPIGILWLRMYVRMSLLYAYCIVFGFSETEFGRIERGLSYSVQAGFLSGRPNIGGVFLLELVLGTAST